MLNQFDAERVAAALRCATACHHCAASCVREKDAADLARCIGLDLDCAGICELVAAATARASENAAAICALCVQLCEACAKECERHAHGHCRECAQACRACADVCRAT